MQKKPLKIKASSFGKDVAAETNRTIAAQQPTKLNFKF